MLRTCDGKDPNLRDAGGEPCACGLTFDDVDRTVIHPHEPVGGGAAMSAARSVAGRLAIDLERPMTDAEAERLKAEFAAEMERQKDRPWKPVILPTAFPTPRQVRDLLRDHVTVVKPGETLVIRLPEWGTPMQMREYQEVLDHAHEDGRLPFKTLVCLGAELGVVESGKPAELGTAGFLADCEIVPGPAAPGVRIRHIPSGISRSGLTVAAAGTALAAELLARGKISVNDARAAHGLRPFDPPLGSGVTADA